MTLPEVYGLLYGFDGLWGMRLHIHSTEYPEFSVKSIPLTVGTFIRDHDPDETLFHVEFFPSHAELWEASCWRNSITRKLKLVGNYANTAADPAEEAYRQLFHNLLTFFRERGLSLKYSRPLAEFLISGKDNPSLLQLAALSPELEYDLKKYRDAQLPQGPSGVDAKT